MARRLRVRPASRPDDTPAEGEAIWRLSRIADSATVERYAGAGRPAPSLVLDRATGQLAATEPRPTDLVIARHQYVLTVTAWDGRELQAFFDPRADAPILAKEDADADLKAALRRAWRMHTDGRPPGGDHVTDWPRLVHAARASEVRPTAETLATDLDVGQRTVERVAAGGPTGDGTDGGMDALRKAAGRQ
jgi:hypothetical protein